MLQQGRLSSPPQTLQEMQQESEDNNFGMALQLKDLFWSAEAFDAGEAMEAALAKLSPDTNRQANVTRWLHWLEHASYQQNIRFSMISAVFAKPWWLEIWIGSPAGAGAYGS